jgi:hypothetical protein
LGELDAEYRHDPLRHDTQHVNVVATVGLRAIAGTTQETHPTRPNVVAMNESKRSIGDTIGQLLVIAILIAILIGAIVLLRDFIDSHNSSSGAPTYNFSCCAALNPNVAYHPGETIRLAWTPVETPSSQFTSKSITLAASLSRSYASIQAIKSIVKPDSSTAGLVPFIATVGPLHVSSRSDVTPVMTLRIPANARTGYYDLITTATERDYSWSGGAILKIRR